MQRFKNILAFVIVAAVLSPGVSIGALLTIDGINANLRTANGFICGTGNQTCNLPDGPYGNYEVNGNTNSFQSSDGLNTDTLKLTNFSIRPLSPNFTVGDAVITYSQTYSSGGTASIGTYTFGDYYGGFFLNNPSTTKAIGDKITMKGSGETPNTLVTLATLSSTVSTTNFVQNPPQGTANTATGLCDSGGEIRFCFETLRQEVTIHFIGRDILNITGSFFLGASSEGSLPGLIAAEAIADLAAFPGDPPEIPEPTTIMLLGTGLAGIFALRRKRLLTRA